MTNESVQFVELRESHGLGSTRWTHGVLAAEPVQLRVIDFALRGARLSICREVRQMWTFGEWKIDPISMSLLDCDGTVVALSAVEYRLLLILLQHPRRVLNRHQLASLMQAGGGLPCRRSVDLIADRLALRLRDDPAAPRYLRTDSQGYMFCQTLEPPLDHA